MSFFKKSLLSFLSFLILFQSFASFIPAHAQGGQWYDSNIYDWFIKVYDTETSQPQDIFGERYTAAQVQWVIYGLIVIPLNMMFSSEFTACTLKAMQSGSDIWPCMLVPGVAEFFVKIINLIKSFVPGVIIYNQSDALNLALDNSPTLDTSNSPGLLSLMFEDRSMSGISYFKNVYRKIQLVPEVHAQAGFGYGALEVLQPLWSKSRDISYGLLILAAIIMAFMIMFRTKVSPQVVISVQSAVPKLIMAIILITFSYAIAGLMIDLMYVIIGIAAAILGSGTTGATTTLYSIMIDGPGGGGIWTLLIVYSFLFPFILFAALGGSGNTMLSFFFSNPLLAIVLILGFGILFVLILFTFLRIVTMIIKTLVSVYLLTIFAPFYILGGAVTPALSFGQWLKDFMGNLMVFPAVGILMIFSLLFINAAVNIIGLDNFPPPIDEHLETLFTLLGTPQIVDFTGSAGWQPPLLGFGGNNGAIVILITSLGIIMLIPKVSDIIKSFMSGRPFAYGSAIGEVVTGAAVGASALTTAPGAIREGINKRIPAALTRFGNRVRGTKEA